MFAHVQKRRNRVGVGLFICVHLSGRPWRSSTTSKTNTMTAWIYVLRSRTCKWTNMCVIVCLCVYRWCVCVCSAVLSELYADHWSHSSKPRARSPQTNMCVHYTHTRPAFGHRHHSRRSSRRKMHTRRCSHGRPQVVCVCGASAQLLLLADSFMRWNRTRIGPVCSVCVFARVLNRFAFAQTTATL